jgi:hypothetical protein
MYTNPTRRPDGLDAELEALLEFEQAVDDVLALVGRGGAR